MPALIQSWVILGMTVVLFVFLILYFYMTRKFNYWKKRGVVEEKPIPFFGSFFPCVTFQKSANDFFRNLYKKYEGEKVVGFYLFDKPCLLVRDIDISNHIMVKDFNLFANRYATAGDHDPLGSKNLFFLKTPHWRTLRTKLSPTFTAVKLRKMTELILDVGKDLENHFESFDLTGDGRVIELNETCAKYTTDVIATCAYGLQVNSLNNPDAEFRKNGQKIFEFNHRRGLEFAAFFFAPAIVKPLGLMVFSKSSSKFLRDVLWDTLAQRMKSGLRRNDLIDTLINLKNSQIQAEVDDPDSFKFDGDNLTAQCAVYFTAGFKTTSITLSYTLYELALHPEMQARVREEITTAFKDNLEELGYDWIMQLPYLDKIVSESLRKYSVLGFIDRVAAVDYKVPDSDLVIEKDTPVFICMAGLHNDPEYFPDPDKYDPERFNTENKQKRPSRAYMPFGEGPRNCIGLRFALVSVKLCLVRMFLNYKFTLCEETVVPARPNPRSFFTEMDHGLFLNVQKITTATSSAV